MFDPLQIFLGTRVGVRQGQRGAIFFGGSAAVSLFFQQLAQHVVRFERGRFFDREKKDNAAATAPPGDSRGRRAAEGWRRPARPRRGATGAGFEVTQRLLHVVQAIGAEKKTGEVNPGAAQRLIGSNGGAIFALGWTMSWFFAAIFAPIQCATAGLTGAIATGMMEKMKRLADYGTAGGAVGSAVIADLSAKNWTDGDCSKAVECLSGENMVAQYGAGKYHCPPCFVGCGKKTKIPQGPHSGEISGAPEYETIGGFGPQCGIYDWNTVIEANDLCNRLGMDTISVSGAVAFVFEAVSKGLIQNPASGPKLEWGSGEGVLSLIRQIAEGEGVGALSAARSSKGSRTTGPGSRPIRHPGEGAGGAIP